MDITELEIEATETELIRFDHRDAWDLGVALRNAAADAALGVAIDIRRAGGAILFRASLPGATIDSEDWILRKSAVAFRFEESSALVHARGWCSADQGRGRGPGRRGDRVGSTSEQEHALVVEKLRKLKTAQSSDSTLPSSRSVNQAALGTGE